LELLAHRARESAAVVVAPRGKNASAHSSSVRRARDSRRSQLCFDCSRIARSNPPPSSSLGDEEHVASLLLSTASRDPLFDCLARQARSARIAL
jgi:hypothetical protein